MRTASKVSDRLKNPGLKIISRQVMNAVYNERLTTYKEVAVHVSSLNENNPSLLDYGEENDASKRQEKNLRRRVYDSLNVLYAVGVLRKQDKKVYCDYNPDTMEKEPLEAISSGSLSSQKPNHLNFSDEGVRGRALPLQDRD
jgi:hypothetical protein